MGEVLSAGFRFDGCLHLTELAEVYLSLGDLDEVFALLNRAFDNREIRIGSLKFNPAFDAARNDPRFDALLKRVGFPANPRPPKIDRSRPTP